MRLLPFLAAGLAALVLAAPAAARPGDVDRSFGNRGGFADSRAGDGLGIAERPNGRLVLPGPSSALQLTRAGRLDRGFGDRGRAPLLGDAFPSEGALDRAGRLVLRTSRYLNGDFVQELVRLRPDGRLDETFGTAGRRDLEGLGEQFSPQGIAIDRRNRIVLAARARIDGRARAVVVRLGENGEPDPSFGTGGYVIGPRGSAFGPAIVQRGRILVPVRPFAPRGRRVSQALLAYRTDGRPLTSYGRRGRVPLTVGSRRFGGRPRVAAGPGRSVVVVGEINSRRRADRRSLHVARVRGSGRIDRRFGARGLVRLYREGLDLAPAAIDTDARGRVLIAANESFPDRVAVFRLRSGGARDRRFGRRGAVRLRLGGRTPFSAVASEATGILAGRRGRIYVAGVTYDDEVEFRDDFGSPHLAVTALRGR